MTISSPEAWERTLLIMAEEAQHPAVPRTPVPLVNSALLAKAYAQCDSVIAEHGKTFNLASALLPPAKRRAIRALYAFCRVADNIVDCGDSPPDAREAELLAWRQRAVTAYPPRRIGDGNDLVAIAWCDTRLHHRVSYKYADQVIEGVALDLHNHRYETFDDLATYAYEVASTVGLMSLRIIGVAPGCSEEEAIPCVIKLGVALQLTNILRDIREDWRSGRVYLPQAELAAFGLTEEDLERGRVDDRWRAFMRFQVERNRLLYREAWPCIAMFNRDGRFAVAAACALYSAILDDIEAHNFDVFNRRAHVSTWGKLRRLPGIWLRNR